MTVAIGRNIWTIAATMVRSIVKHGAAGSSPRSVAEAAVVGQAAFLEGDQTMKQNQRPGRIHRVAVLVAACAALVGVSPARSALGVACTGDCNSDGTVSVNELVTMVKMALGSLDMSACAVADADGDGAINIDELLRAVGAALGECASAPDLVGAVALSRHYVEVEFTGSVGPGAVQPGRYSITAPDGSSLAVNAARVMDDPTRVLLTTDAQQPVVYRLTLQTSGNAIATTAVAGNSNQEPQLQTAIALNNTQVLLSFDQAVAGGATTIDFYRIVVAGGDPPQDIGDLQIASAVLSANGFNVTLTTSPQADLQYEVIVTNVASKSGNQLIDPTRNTALFFGKLAVDTVKPQVSGAVATSATTVLVSFNEPLRSDPLDNPAQDASNYSLAPAVTVTGATLNESATQVLLTTLPLAEGIPFTLTVANVKDLAGNLIDPAHKSATFTFQGEAGLNDKDLPRVVGAASTGNNGVVVQFSRPMGDSATIPGSYVIVTADVNPEVGALSVTAAAFTGEDRTAVNLTTFSQNEVTYVLTVVNVKDFIGLPMAPKQIIAGVLLDPSSATFPGTPPVCPRACTNGDPGVDGSGLCASDADCTRTPPCTAGSCVGACTPCTLNDTDSDALTDNDEQRGWVVTITLANGSTITRQVTSDPGLEDTDGDGLSDALEKNIGTDPRQVDTDGDQLSDGEEYNLVYTDPTNQDTDGDGISDNLEVEFFKTNALLADSDGDGYTDSQELFEMNRDPRIADLPAPDFSIGEVRLQINEQFTYTDENGQTQSQDSSTETSLTIGNQESNGTTEDIGGGFEAFAGIVPSQDPESQLPVVGSVTFTGIFNRNVQTTSESNSDAERAFQNSLDKASEFSTDSAVTREITGARVDVTVTFENKGDVAFTLSNLELTALTADPQDPSRLVPVATLLPDSQQQSGNAATFSVGPGQTRGPIVFSNREAFPNLVEDLMKAPRGLVFKVANYDLTTGDGRNFAYGLQTVRERTTNLTIDFGDGEVKQWNAITAAVLNRPRDELRCAPGGDHPDRACASDADCGTSKPCTGGSVIGGLSQYTGTGVSPGIPLDFVLRDILQMHRSTPPVILAGAGGWSLTQVDPKTDDIQVVENGTNGLAPDTVVVAPGRNGVIDTVPGAELAAYPDIVAGPNGIVDSVAQGDDVQTVPVGTTGVRPDMVVIAPGPNSRLDTTPLGDDVAEPYRFVRNLLSQGAAIVAGPDGVADTVAAPGDIQVIPPGTRNLPSDAIVVAAAGPNVITSLKDAPPSDISRALDGDGLLKTTPSGDDVVTGPDGILAGKDGMVDSVAQGDDVQLVPVGTRGVPEDTVAVAAGQNGILETPRLGDDVADVVTGYEVSRTCNFNTPTAIVAGPDGVANTTVAEGLCTTASPPHFVGEPGCTVDIDCGIAGVCSSDYQYAAPGTDTGDANFAVISPKGKDGKPVRGTSLRTVPLLSSDDQYVGPGIPCTTTADCTVDFLSGPDAGECSGPQAVVRVAQRRSGQFRRYWALLSNKAEQVQTDFGQILVKPGDAINLAFVQDADRDGLIAPEEFLHGTSDFNRDTDNDRLDDFAEIRVGWLVGPIGQPLRRVFPDPTKSDSDGDGLSDRDEQDLRRLTCACDAVGPKILLGSGNVLRGEPYDPGKVAIPCSTNDECGPGSVCRDTARCTTADYLQWYEHRVNLCPPCDSDPSLHRSDPRLKDTDGDGVTDGDEVFGYRTGAGIVSAPTAGNNHGHYKTVVAGADKKANNTVACPDNYCVEDVILKCSEDSDDPGKECVRDSDCSGGTCKPLRAGTCTGGSVLSNKGAVCVDNSDCLEGATCTFDSHCQTDGDCRSHQCIHQQPCDDVQVVPPNTDVEAANTVVVAPGIYRAFDDQTPITIDDQDVTIQSIFEPSFCSSAINTLCDSDSDCMPPFTDTSGKCIVFTQAGGVLGVATGSIVALSTAVGDDIQVVPYGESVTEFTGTIDNPKQPRCVDGSEFYAGAFFGLAQRFIMCGIVKPGPNGRIDSAPIVGADQAQCSGGTLDGQPCNLQSPDPLQCPPLRVFICSGGSKAGQPCNSISDCPSFGPLDPAFCVPDGFETGSCKETFGPRDNLLVPAGSGQKIEVTDPLNPDTDGDEIADGIERLLGASPNDPGDTGITDDTDDDGLTDNAERAGWTVTVAGIPRKVTSSLYNADTDGDGIPDYAEFHMPCWNDLTKVCRTDPTKADTDGDGLSDLDELSTDQIAVLSAFNGVFRGYHFNGSASKHYGTDPLNKDTDTDGLSDFDELLMPFKVTVPGETVVRTGFTDPTKPDTDDDDLSDSAEELTYKTDPTDPDTDGDGRLDGREKAVNGDPLVKDKVVTVTYRGVTLQSITVGDDAWLWKLYVQHPPNAPPSNPPKAPAPTGFPGEAISDVGTECSIEDTAIPKGTHTEDASCHACNFHNPSVVPINEDTNFILREGEGFLLSGDIASVSTCSSGVPTYLLYDRFFESYGYETVSSFTSKTLTFDFGNSHATLIYEITTE